jgi:asparagine synthase (glutamine-hydrolysing)
MCGVNGIFAYHSASGPPNEDELLATRDAMRARGPDGSGVWWSADRRCGLGHRRLSILDLSDRASQPMASDNGHLVITFNGEIYNYPALRAELETGGARFRTTSDTEVLLHLYARYGAAMLHRLRGMFALAIWDDARRELFLARDPYGIKPLYTANDGWTFRFASQVKALLAGGRVSRDLEPAGLVGFHLFGSVPEPFTLYRDIRALPAGHTQRVDAAGPREPEPFASLAVTLAAGARNPAPPSELQDRVRAAVLDSVRAHLLADVEVGIFLSGGIKSGALLGLMRDAGRDDIRAITLAFEEFRGTAEDEASLAGQVTKRYGAEHIVRRVSETEFRDDLPAILDAMDQPSIDGVNTWFVAKAAKEAGLKVALSGIGGDELLAGYPSFVYVPRWRRRLGPIAAVPGLGRLAGFLIQAVAPTFVRERPKALGLLQYSNRWAGAYLLRRGLFLPYELPKIMDLDLAREGLRRLKLLRGLAESLEPDPKSDVGRVYALESANYLRNQLLRDADWAGMAHSLSIRMPLVDIALLKSLAPVLPALTPGAGNAALAKAPTLALPNEIPTTAKTGFGVPTGAWIDAASNDSDTMWGRTSNAKELVSRRWSHAVMRAFAYEVQLIK